MTKFLKTAVNLEESVFYDAYYVKEVTDKAVGNMRSRYFYGCSKSILLILEKKKIPEDQYVFASYSESKGYKPCSNEYKNRRIMLKADWVEKNVVDFKVVSEVKESEKEEVKEPENEDKSEVEEEDKSYFAIPNLLTLDFEERFKDDQGRYINIEVRGEKHYKNIWFKAKDVGEMLGNCKIRDTLNHKNSTFVKGKHYQIFNLVDSRGDQTEEKGDQLKGLAGSSGKPLQNKNELSIFLNYIGLTKLLFSSRKPLAEKFQEWACKILFTAQMGTDLQKREMVADIMGVTPQELKAVLQTNTGSMPAVYLFTLGTVKELRDKLKLPSDKNDDDIVVKFGRTDDLARRTREHAEGFGKLGISIAMKYHVFIDPVHTSKAEVNIKRFFMESEWFLDLKKHKELAAVPSDSFKRFVRPAYIRLGETYAGKLKDFQHQLSSKDTSITVLEEKLKTQEDNHSKILKVTQENLEECKSNAKEKADLSDKLISSLQQQNEVLKEMLRMMNEAKNK